MTVWPILISSYRNRVIVGGVGIFGLSKYFRKLGKGGNQIFLLCDSKLTHFWSLVCIRLLHTRLKNWINLLYSLVSCLAHWNEVVFCSWIFFSFRWKRSFQTLSTLVFQRFEWTLWSFVTLCIICISEKRFHPWMIIYFPMNFENEINFSPQFCHPKTKLVLSPPRLDCGYFLNCGETIRFLLAAVTYFPERALANVKTPFGLNWVLFSLKF